MKAFEPGSNAKARQQRLILDALRDGPASTVELRERLGVMHVGGRVMELRRGGFDIETVRKTIFDSEGRPHRSALYRLRGPK
ncbi:MAG: hypothetical protein IV105_17635 [Rhizobacter sp.]|nr:hypothetical protein [Rhizobacter sp.]